MLKNIPFLSIGFRPFFLLSALSAWLFPNIWATYFSGQINLDNSPLDPYAWHVHEMIFGFAGAMITGFLFTASSNWASKTPWKGIWLLIPFLLWLAERITMLFVPSWPAFFIGLLYWILLMVLLEITLWKNWRNFFPFLGILTLFLIAKILIWSGAYVEEGATASTVISGKIMALAIMRYLLLFLMERVYPFFSNKRMPQANIQSSLFWRRVHLGVQLLLVYPAWDFEVSSAISLVAAVLLISRILAWKPWITWKEPMLAILGVGLSFIAIGEIIDCLYLFLPQRDYGFPAQHAFAMGGLGCIGIGMMSRVALGHSGRVIKACKWILLSFIFTILGALIRVVAPFLSEDFYRGSIHYASGIWSMAFLIYTIRFFKIFISPRPDGREH